MYTVTKENRFSFSIRPNVNYRSMVITAFRFKLGAFRARSWSIYFLSNYLNLTLTLRTIGPDHPNALQQGFLTFFMQGLLNKLFEARKLCPTRAPPD